MAKLTIRGTVGVGAANDKDDLGTVLSFAAVGRPAGETRSGDVVVHWIYKASEGKLERVVVAGDLTTAYETVVRPCGAPPHP